MNPKYFPIPVRKLKNLTPSQLDKQHKLIENASSLEKYEISVLQYNVLADCYTKLWYSTHYGLKDRRVLQDFKFRAPRVIAEIAGLKPADKPNIICLNEIDHYEDFYKP